MAPMRGTKKRKRVEKAALAPSPGLSLPPLPNSADWWDVFFRRIADSEDDFVSYTEFLQDNPFFQENTRPWNMEYVLMMSRKTFNYICSLVKKDFTTKTHGFRNFRFGEKTILGVEDQVAVAIMRLTSGESLQNIGMWFGMNHSAISDIKYMAECAICHLKWPSPEEIAIIKARFEKIYGLPKCIEWMDDSCILCTSCFYRLCEKGVRLDMQMELPGGSLVTEY